MPVYRVTVSFQFHALTGNETEARYLADRAASDCALEHHCVVKEIESVDMEYPDELVYGPGDETTLQDAFEFCETTSWTRAIEIYRRNEGMQPNVSNLEVEGWIRKEFPAKAEALDWEAYNG